ncbi:MAG: glycoside hydrolase family 13 protein [Anaerolineae bacterium]
MTDAQAVLQTPDWVKHAVFYQVFPDRFARSPRTHHARGLSFKPWGSPPEEQGFQGGDLRGIVDHMHYLRTLGVTALYLNPIFAAAANHRYHTYDYLQVDPILGGESALRELLAEAHAHGLRVILDGVFNHASRGFWPFHHVLENGENSPYVDWFIIRGWPLRPYSEAEGLACNYDAWWNLPALPKLNVRNPGVRDYLLGVARYWLEFGIDGWRLDVPNEIDDDEFWRDFRTVVKGANCEAYICGEIWGPAQRWLQGDQFDGVMNYPLGRALISFCGSQTLRRDFHHDQFRLQPLDAAAFGRELEHLLGLYDWEITQAQLNLLDSHDLPRALWLMGNDESALRLCVLMQMTLPGAPCIYYGDEIGLSTPGDPYCRGAFPWQHEETWNRDLLAYYRGVISMRHRLPVLRTGRLRPVLAEGRFYAFRRTLGRHEAVVAVNADTRSVTAILHLPGLRGQTLTQMWPERPEVMCVVEDGHISLTVPARQGVVLVTGE